MLDEFATEVLSVELLPYQRWLAIHALELAPGLTVGELSSLPEGKPVFRFRRVVVLISRQNGKTLFSQILAAFFLYCMSIRLIIGTAQSLSLAEEVMFGVHDMIKGNEFLDSPDVKLTRGNTQKSLSIPSHKAEYITKAMTGGAGRGRTADLLLLDELREQKDWKAWAAIKNTTAARSRALIWCMSNAGDVESVVLRTFRIQAHKELGDPDGIAAAGDPAKLLDPAMLDSDEELSSTRSALFEWSSPPGADKDDPAALAQANPAMNYTGLTYATLSSDAKSDPEWVFRTESMCQWPDGSLVGPFPPGAWDAGVWRAEDHPGEDMPEAVGAEKVCLSRSADRSMMHIVIAGRTADGRIVLHHQERRAGTEWVAEWLDRNKGLYDEITGQTNGSAVSELLERLKNQGYPVVDWKGPELTAGMGTFYDAVVKNEITHFPQDHLDIAASTAATKMLGSGAMVFDLVKSPVDAAPLLGAAGAYWLLTRDKKPERRSAYEGRRLLIL